MNRNIEKLRKENQKDERKTAKPSNKANLRRKTEQKAVREENADN